MKEDEVLAQVRDHVRAERADDAALEAVARGEAGTEVVAALEARAGGDEEAAALLAASRPLGDDVIARIAKNAAPAPASAPARAPAPASAPASASAPARAPAPASAPAKVVPLTRRVARFAAPLALAAAVVLYLGLREPSPSGALLPAYSVVAGGPKEMRGADDASSTLVLRGGPDAEFELLARPATTTSKVVAYVFAIGEGEPNPVDAKIEIAPEGAVRVRGRARALEGAREVRIVLGTATDSITRYEDALTRARSGASDAKVRVLVVPISRR